MTDEQRQAIDGDLERRAREFFTVVFRGDIGKIAENPLKIESAFGPVVAAERGHAFAAFDALESESDALRTVSAERDAEVKRLTHECDLSMTTIAAERARAEKAEAERDAAREELDDERAARLAVEKTNVWHLRAKAAEAELAKAREELARAREALGKVESVLPDGCCEGGCTRLHYEQDDTCRINAARLVIAVALSPHEREGGE